MSLYVQYHNVEREGLLISNPPFSRTEISIFTRLPQVKNASGQVFLIAGLGKPRRYYLWSTFELERVTENNDGSYQARGTGWELAPPALLEGATFEEFKSSCANFVGFRSISDLTYSKTLQKLAHKHRSKTNNCDASAFFQGLRTYFNAGDPAIDQINQAFGEAKPTRALSIRQPHAEAIMRGVKKIEYRNSPTKIRERVYIYASLGRYSAGDEADMMDEYDIHAVSCEELPRGVLIGTVELFDCDGGDWHLRAPERAVKLLKPDKQPQPVWFRPF